MSRRYISLKISLLLLFFYSASHGQSKVFDTVAFYRHLVAENLLPEQIVFNRQLLASHTNNRIVSDSVHVNQALVYTRLNMPDSAFANLNKVSPAPNLTGGSSDSYLALLILNGKYSDIDKYTIGYNNLRPVSYTDAKFAGSLLQGKDISKDTGLYQLSPAMQGIKLRYENFHPHSAFLAGTYSAIIPGLGKLYLGYKQQALTDFIANLALGGQTAEAYFREGPKSARFIVSASLFGLFYGGNIWGSALLAKKQKRDHYKQTEYEIHNYYNSVIGIAAR